MDLQTKEQVACKSEYMYKEKGQRRTSTSHGGWLCFPGHGKHFVILVTSIAFTLNLFLRSIFLFALSYVEI